MNQFNQFNIKLPQKGFEGSKIKISRILNREIIIHDFKIEDSKIEAFRSRGSDKCLCIQISMDGEKHIVFTSSACLIEMISQVPRDRMPFIAKIINDNERYLFI